MRIEMASPSLFQFFFFIPLLLVIITPSHSSELNSPDAKVNVSLYYETLCPGSMDFIVNQLGDLFKLDIMSIVNLHLVPYGNARITQKGNVECQHGPLECFYNTIEACALDIWSLKNSFPFINCVEAGLLKNETSTVWEPCCKQLRLDPTNIEYCYAGAHGIELIMRNANEAGSLNPPHKYVPWVLVNDQQISDVENLVHHVCNAYKGPRKFKACKGKVVITSTEKKMKATQAVYHYNEGGVPIIRTITM